MSPPLGLAPAGNCYPRLIKTTGCRISVSEFSAPPGATDACIAEARSWADRKAVKVLSLDVFDTLLWRAVPEPVDAFAEIGRSLSTAGRLHVPAVSFSPLREAAEARARDRSQLEQSTTEVSLEQIYEELPPTGRNGSPAELASLRSRWSGRSPSRT